MVPLPGGWCSTHSAYSAYRVGLSGGIDNAYFNNHNGYSTPIIKHREPIPHQNDNTTKKSPFLTSVGGGGGGGGKRERTGERER